MLKSIISPELLNDVYSFEVLEQEEDKDYSYISTESISRLAGKIVEPQELIDLHTYDTVARTGKNELEEGFVDHIDRVEVHHHGTKGYGCSLVNAAGKNMITHHFNTHTQAMKKAKEYHLATGKEARIHDMTESTELEELKSGKLSESSDDKFVDTLKSMLDKKGIKLLQQTPEDKEKRRKEREAKGRTKYTTGSEKSVPLGGPNEPVVNGRAYWGEETDLEEGGLRHGLTDEMRKKQGFKRPGQMTQAEIGEHIRKKMAEKGIIYNPKVK